MEEPSKTAWLSLRVLILRILAILIGAVFVYAGFLKARDPLHFANDINNYQIVPWSIGVRLAFYLPWLEIFCGLALIFHWLFRGAVLVTGVLVVVFIAATASARARGIDVACGCFGSASTNLTLTWHLVLNFTLLAALVVLWFLRPGVRRLA